MRRARGCGDLAFVEEGDTLTCRGEGGACRSAASNGGGGLKGERKGPAGMREGA
jgi:hypothetical protein